MAQKYYLEVQRKSPNFVRTSFLNGNIFFNRAKLETSFKDKEKAKALYQTALGYFLHYLLIDPVHYVTYEKITEILVGSQNYDEALRLLDQALFFNDQRAKDLYGESYLNKNIEVALLRIIKGKVYWQKAKDNYKNPFRTVVPEIEMALHLFKRASEEDPTNKEAKELIRHLSNQMGVKK